MAYLNFKKIIATGTIAMGAIVTGSLLMVGCFGHKESSDPLQDAHLKVRVGVVDAGYSPLSSSPPLEKIVISLTSTSNDTILETITSKTSPALNLSGSGMQTFNMAYSLEPLRVWKVVAKALDNEGHILHVDSATTSVLQVSGSEHVSLELSIGEKNETLSRGPVARLPQKV